MLSRLLTPAGVAAYGALFAATASIAALGAAGEALSTRRANRQAAQVLTLLLVSLALMFFPEARRGPAASVQTLLVVLSSVLAADLVARGIATRGRGRSREASQGRDRAPSVPP